MLQRNCTTPKYSVYYPFHSSTRYLQLGTEYSYNTCWVGSTPALTRLALRSLRSTRRAGLRTAGTPSCSISGANTTQSVLYTGQSACLSVCRSFQSFVAQQCGLCSAVLCCVVLGPKGTGDVGGGVLCALLFRAPAQPATKTPLLTFACSAQFFIIIAPRVALPTW